MNGHPVNGGRVNGHPVNGGRVNGHPVNGGSLTIRRAELDGVLVDVHIDDGIVVAIEPTARRPARRQHVGGEEGAVDARGGAIVPGLHDHHVHLAATAAARESVDAGGSDLCEFATALRARVASLGAGAWVRAVDYDEATAGDLDRDLLDAIVPGSPVRVQHRSGAAWFVNSAGLAALGVTDGPDGEQRAGLERDARGRATGRLFRLDGWLRDRLGSVIPDLAPVGAELARVGVVGCTDATPWATAAELAAFTAALSAARLPQRVLTMAGPGVVAAGPVKVVLGDHDLPALGEIEQWFAEAHDAGRPVAVHCVTAAALALSIAAWDAVGAHPGDRVEHAAVVPTTAIDVLAGLGVRVVTQPALVVERGDRYLARVPAGEHDELWRCASLLAGGVRVAAGSDCPYGPLDPWAAMRGAVTRSTAGGRVLGIAERVAPGTALELFLSELDDPGGRPRRVRVGARADVCVLDAPLPDVLAEPDAGRVVATVIGGRVVHPS